MVDLFKDGVVTYCVFVDKVVRMEEDVEESDEISGKEDCDTDDI